MKPLKCLDCKGIIVANETYNHTNINVCENGHRTGMLTVDEVKAIINRIGDKPKARNRKKKESEEPTVFDGWQDNNNLVASGLESASNE